MSAKKTIIMLMIMTVLIAGVNVVASLDAARNSLTSFPWWSVIVLSAYYFGPALLLEGIALVGVHLWQKHKKNEEE